MMNMTILGIITSILSATISGFIAMMMKNINDDTRAYREKREEEEMERKQDEERKKKEEEKEKALQRQALVVIMRMILKDNADRCFEKGFYSLAEREVFRPVYDIYMQCVDDHNIKDLGAKLRNLPYEK